MFDLSFDKILVLLVIAALLIGPKRLPVVAAQLARLATRLRELGGAARDRAAEELGPEFAEVEWRKLDPRQYDPRRIIRDALLEPPARMETEEEIAARLEAFGPPPELAAPEPAAPEPQFGRPAIHAPATTAAALKETHAAGDRPDSDR